MTTVIFKRRAGSRRAASLPRSFQKLVFIAAAVRVATGLPDYGALRVFTNLLQTLLKNHLAPVLLSSLVLLVSNLQAQRSIIDQYNPVWTNQSANSGESMPCGGGDIGLNVWTENGEILFYIAKSGTFDEHNTLLKMGRVRIKLYPNPFDQGSFKQELKLREGHVVIEGEKAGLKAAVSIWVDVHNPAIHVSVNTNKPVKTTALYESWRYEDRQVRGRANFGNSYKWAPQGEVITYRDSIRFKGDGVQFYHHNRASTVFDVTVKQQGLDEVKDQLFNPIAHLAFGGIMQGDGMKSNGIIKGKYIDTDFQGWKLESRMAVRSQAVNIYLFTKQNPSINSWQDGLDSVITKTKTTIVTDRQQTLDWWRAYWERSFIAINPGAHLPTDTAWQVGRNYQLMRYMLGCNATGQYPTKFNGGLFTYDPVFTDTALHINPDFRNWGGGTHTAQNQRLVYFPMLKTGDFDLMKPQFDFYQRLLRNAELRSEFYWNHKGASFTEQLENFGLPNPAEYGWKRPADYDKGMEYNAWLEYQWDTALEFCFMILETQRYAGKDIRPYLPLIESCLQFFNEHYQYLAKQRGSKALNANGQLVLYPGSAAETFKMAYNANSTIAALRTVTESLLALPVQYLDDNKRKAYDSLLKRIPPISFGSFNGHPTIAAAQVWERVNNTESPQLYPVYPWGIYGMGKPGLQVARNTYLYDTNVVKFRSHVGWKQDNIFAARLGLTTEAVRLNTLKLKNSGRKFPAFWGPGYDWTPDHNWGGSGMIGLQEMLLQTDGKKILLFPAWPPEWDVHFKLFAPYNTTVEGVLKNGKVVSLKVNPQEREADVINLYLK